MNLTEQQRAFCRFYAEGQTGLEAYRRAYPTASPDSARSAAARLLKRPGVQDDIQRLRASVESCTLMTLAEKRAYLAAVVRAAPADIDENSPLAQRVQESHGVRTVWLPDKLRAIELDAKLAGEFRDKLEITPSDDLSEFLVCLRQGI